MGVDTDLCCPRCPNGRCQCSEDCWAGMAATEQITPAAGQLWQWWSGSSDEWFTNGPFDTREAAIAALDGYGGHIIEATAGRLSFSAEELIGHQYFENDDLFDHEYSEPDRAGAAETITTADGELQSLLDAWLDRWRHTFVPPAMFASSRNREQIAADDIR